VIVPVARIGLVAVDQGLVWLVTDEGKLRSAARSIDQLERQLEPAGFVRVSRVALVNIERVREVIPAFKGGMWIAVDGVSTPVAVARRRVAALRRALGI
jgi:two-component system LytT family response regulator/two-component system response regulator LytT